MSYKKHPPKAPHFDEQGRVAFEHIHALIGNKVWNAWGFGKDKGNGLEWGLLRDKLGLERDYKPIILDTEKLAKAGDYQILKDDVHAVTFYRFGNVTSDQENALFRTSWNNSPTFQKYKKDTFYFYFFLLALESN